MIQHVVEGPRIGNDAHPYVIALFRALQTGWEPPDSVSRDDYACVKQNITAFEPELAAFVGFGCSFGGKWWGGYARTDPRTGNSCADVAARHLLAQAPKLRGVQFIEGSYLDLAIPPRSIIYCDPPYANTVSYSGIPPFDVTQFWEWCDLQVEQGHRVFVSEYSLPDIPVVSRVECVWQQEVKTNLDRNNSQMRVERLYQLT